MTEVNTLEIHVHKDLDHATAAVVKDGVVENIIVVVLNNEGNADFELSDSEVVVLAENEIVQVGQKYEYGQFLPYEPPASTEN